MLKRNEFEIEREQFLEAFCDNITSMMGIEVGSPLSISRFSRFTDIAFELANFGTMDSFLSFDEFDLVAFVETMETMLPTVAGNMNIEQEYPTLTTAVNCLGLYLSLYIVEDKDVATYCEITNEAIAAVLGVKVSTLKNMVSLKSLAAMDNDELRQFLEVQERFKPFNKYDSVSFDAPLELSGVDTSQALIYAIEQRAAKYGLMAILEDSYHEVGINQNADSAIKFTALFSTYGRPAHKVGTLLGRLNIESDSLNTAVSNVSAEMMSVTSNSTALLNYTGEPKLTNKKSTDENRLNPYIFQRPDVPYTSDSLGDYLKVEFGFSTHPDDRGKNTKLFALKKGSLPIAIERTKTPSVWVPHNIAEKLNPDDFEITWYEASETGAGRHSALHSYSDFHTVAIAKVKVKSFKSADKLMNQLL